MLHFRENQVHNVTVNKAGIQVEQFSLPLLFAGITLLKGCSWVKPEPFPVP